MDKLHWFKFTPTDWVMGKIQRCPEITQARFMRLICLYWNKECVLSYEDAEIEIDKEHLDILISKKIIKLNENFVSIEFLNEQLVDISETSQKRRDAVLKRWNKVKQNDTIVLNSDTIVLQSDTDKIREDEIREDEKIKILNNSLLSEIKISDDKKFFLVKDLQFEITEEKLLHYKTALGFQKLFIKNLKEKNSPTSQTEKATYKNFVEPIRLIFEKKEATKEQLREAYEYLNSKEGEFWKSNILSTKKLREKLSMMILKKNTKVIDLNKKEVLVPDPNKRRRFT
jgi:hypothetical protein